MNLKQERISRKLKQCDVVEALLPVDSRMTVPILSNIESGIVRPSRRVESALRAMFHADSDPVEYKLTVRISRKLLDEFRQTKGNVNLTRWIESKMIQEIK